MTPNLEPNPVPRWWPAVPQPAGARPSRAAGAGAGAASDIAATSRAATRLAAALIAVALLAPGRALAADATSPAESAAASLQPFKAAYMLEWKGMDAATASLELTHQADGQWSYVSRNNARGIFRAVFPGELTQVSRLRVEAGGVRPLSYRGDDGSSDKAKDIALDFDWARRRVTGTAERKPVDLEVHPGVQDVMSVQIALIVDLMAGRQPSGYTLVDKDKVKDYVYAGEGKARVATTLGTLETVIWASHRPNSDRVTRVWYAPSLGYLPVKAERRRGSKLEWSMRLVSVQR